MSQDVALALRAEHPRQFTCASIVLGRTLMDLETNGERKSRKRRVLERRLAMFRDTIPEAATLTDLSAVKAPVGFTREHGAALVVDLAFSAPFAPYELEVGEADFGKALQATGTEMNFGKALMDRVLVLKDEAMKAHSRGFFSSPWSLVVAGALAATAALPLLPAIIGGVGSLAGAAAASHGLALLGGGSLAMGGFGMAGGTWVLAGLGTAAVATAGVGVRELVYTAPAAVIRVEVAKCQTTVVLQMENGTWSRDDVASQLKRLEEVKEEVLKDLTEERGLNDSGARRIRELEEKERALATARDWIAQRLG